MNPDFKPMLAGTLHDWDALTYPQLATPKLDGIRCVIRDGVPLTRSLKPVPNRYITSLLRGYPSFDGELTCGRTFQSSTSAIMSEDGEPDFTYTIFDLSEPPDVMYRQRMGQLHIAESVFAARHLRFLYPVEVHSRRELEDLCARHLEWGYEGTMIRTPSGLYKYGRSTEREGWLLKIKPMEDAEATIIGFEEQYRNTNAATRNALGRLERSSHQAGLVAKGTLGKILVTNKQFGDFSIGTGFDDALRSELWAHPKQYLGRKVKFKYQNYGIKDKPRLPVFLGFRDARDL